MSEKITFSRPWTPDRRNDNGSTTVTVKRACNGCGELLGDVTDAEMDGAIAGSGLSDVRGECPNCAPVYARSISGPMSGLVTPPRCRQGHLLSVCECWRNNRTEER